MLAKTLADHVFQGEADHIQRDFDQLLPLAKGDATPIEKVVFDICSKTLRQLQEGDGIAYFVLDGSEIIARELNQNVVANLLGAVGAHNVGSCRSGPDCWFCKACALAAMNSDTARARDTQDKLLKDVNTHVKEFFGKFSDSLKQRKSNLPSGEKKTFYNTDTFENQLGGMVSLLERPSAAAPNGTRQTTAGSGDDAPLTPASRFAKFIPAPNAAPKVTNGRKVWSNYLYWRRGEQGWRYTFVEGFEGQEEDFKKRVATNFPIRESFPKWFNEQVQQNEFEAQLEFPGHRVGGAQYMIFPAMFLLQQFHLHKTATAVDTIFGQHCPTLKLATPIVDKILALPECDKRSDELKSIIADKKTKKVIFHEFNLILQHLFERCYGKAYGHENLYSDNTGDRQALDPFEGRGADDFISSSMIDGAALYFTNFRPLLLKPPYSFGFTRTFVVDFGMTPYQRGRLIRTVSDMNTYRTLILRDSARFRALQACMAALNAKLPTPTLDDQSTLIDPLQSILGDLQHYDSYFPGGIYVRTRGIRNDALRIMESVKLLREERIEGYALLSDFLRRSIAPTVEDAVKIGERVRSLRENVRDRLNLVRSNATTRMMRQLKNYASELTKLTKAAEIVGVIAGTYYLSSILSYAAKDVCKLIAKCSAEALPQTPFYIVALLVVVMLVKVRRGDAPYKPDIPVPMPPAACAKSSGSQPLSSAI